MIKSSSRWRAAYCSGFGPLRAIGWVPDIARLGLPKPLLACTRCGPIDGWCWPGAERKGSAVSRMYYAWHNDAQRP